MRFLYYGENKDLVVPRKSVLGPSALRRPRLHPERLASDDPHPSQKLLHFTFQPVTSLKSSLLSCRDTCHLSATGLSGDCLDQLVARLVCSLLVPRAWCIVGPRRMFAECICCFVFSLCWKVEARSPALSLFPDTPSPVNFVL